MTRLEDSAGEVSDRAGEAGGAERNCKHGTRVGNEVEATGRTPARGCDRWALADQAHLDQLVHPLDDNLPTEPRDSDKVGPGRCAAFADQPKHMLQVGVAGRGSSGV
jgi:hypothetical protein